MKDVSNGTSPALGQRMEVHVSGAVELLDADLGDISHRAQLGVVLQFDFLDMAFTVASRENSIHSHDAPPYGIAKILRSGLNRPKSDFRNYTSSTNLLLLNLFNGRRGYAIGPIEEVGIVGRSSGDEEEVLLWAFQSWNGRFRVVLQLL